MHAGRAAGKLTALSTTHGLCTTSQMSKSCTVSNKIWRTIGWRSHRQWWAIGIMSANIFFCLLYTVGALLVVVA